MANRRRAWSQYRWAIVFAEREQFLAQIGVGHPHPSREPRADAIGHFRRAGLGEGQAQDALRPHAAEQQGGTRARSAPGSCRSRPRPTGRHAPTDRPRALLAFKHGQGFQATRHDEPLASRLRFPSGRPRISGSATQERRMSERDDEESERTADQIGQGRGRGRDRIGGDRRGLALCVQGQEAEAGK